jgi:hypothetical protein
MIGYACSVRKLKHVVVPSLAEGVPTKEPIFLIIAAADAGDISAENSVRRIIKSMISMI